MVGSTDKRSDVELALALKEEKWYRHKYYKMLSKVVGEIRCLGCCRNCCNRIVFVVKQANRECQMAACSSSPGDDGSHSFHQLRLSRIPTFIRFWVFVMC
jgi:hypothetical protein